MSKEKNSRPQRGVMRGSGYLEGDGVSPHAAHADHKHEEFVNKRPRLEEPLPEEGTENDVYFAKTGVYWFDGQKYVRIASNGPVASDVTPPPIAEEGHAGVSFNYARADHSHGTKNPICLGMQIDTGNPDPDERVTYLRDAAGCTPAGMNFAKDMFEIGSWGDAFFMPKPCMCTFDGETDYYLDQNDLTKRADGGGKSDIADEFYNGNAMIEWGKGGVIWYKLVPPSDSDRMAKIYIANHAVDDGFHCWSFYNHHDRIVQRFYTAIYAGSMDRNHKIRSLSGMKQGQMIIGKRASFEIEFTRLNNPEGKDMWYTETYADFLLITILTWMMGKTTAPMRHFGVGYLNSYEAKAPQPTGEMNKKGMFYGDPVGEKGMKLFGMENYWGNLLRRTAGIVINKSQLSYKMCYGMADGSDSMGYNVNGMGYLQGNIYAGGTIQDMQFNADGSILPKKHGTATDTTFYTEKFVTAREAGAFGYALRGITARERYSTGLWSYDMSHDEAYGLYNTTVAISCRPEK